jgi:hypothetical protein
MSYKNKLQEYCLKNGFELPIYSSSSIGESHLPLWKSIVYVSNVNFSCEYSFPSKVKAEQFVAMNAYQYLQPKTDYQKQYTNPSWIALIDIENIQPKIYYNKPVEYHIFLSEYSSIDTSEYKDCIVHKINSSSNEATDHLMTYEAGRLLYTKPDIKNYLILSRDKSSGILNNLLKRDGNDVVHFKNKKDFENFILTLN